MPNIFLKIEDHIGGVYETEKLAFFAAVEKFGITAETHDAIIDHVVGILREIAIENEKRRTL